VGGIGLRSIVVAAATRLDGIDRSAALAGAPLALSNCLRARRRRNVSRDNGEEAIGICADRCGEARVRGQGRPNSDSESAWYVPGVMSGTNCATKAWDIGITSIARRVSQVRSAS